MSLKRKAADLAAADAKKPKANGSITAFFSAPKPATTAVNQTATTTTNANGTTTTTLATTAAPSAASKFDKAAWVAKLTDEQRELLKLEIDTLHESWLAPLKDELTSKSFLELKRFLKKEKDSGKIVFPPLQDVYSWYVSAGFCV